jgi:hypothetical protein
MAFLPLARFFRDGRAHFLLENRGQTREVS